ncbi:hypothetical protein M0R04_15790 [Candidatus Dojkabacteria bacterium]|jgi:hypothetical protein|nr:hypothetical protein [Candidatus Dojkabacteria bacterium]
MPLEQIYNSQDNAIKSYSFTDIVSGKGYKKFYGAETLSGAGTAGYILSPEVIGSNTIVKTVAVGAGFTKVIDLDFTTTFDTTATIEGDAIVSFTAGTTSATSGNRSTYKVVAEVYQNATFLASGATAIIPKSSDTGVQGTYSIMLDIAKTDFIEGDVLKLNMEVWSEETTDSGTCLTGIGIDPRGRDDPTAGFVPIDAGSDTELEFYVPFKIDI